MSNTSQVVHIVSEIVVLLSITGYFMNENRKLVSRIDSLSKKLEDQEEKLEKHDSVILDILKHLETNKPTIVVDSLPSLSSPSSSISYKTTGCCIMNSNGEQMCTVPMMTSDGLDDIDEEGEDMEEEDEEEDEVIDKPSISDNVVILMSPMITPFSTSKVEEVVEEDEILPLPPPPPPVEPKKKRKRNKNRSKQTTVNDIDKELENELNELLNEETHKKN